MLRVRSSEHLQAQKDLGSTLLCHFCSCQTRRNWMGGAAADIAPTPTPPGCLKLALFLFLFYLPHNEVGGWGGGGWERGVKCPTAGSAF